MKLVITVTINTHFISQSGTKRSECSIHMHNGPAKGKVLYERQKGITSQVEGVEIGSLNARSAKQFHFY